MSVNEFKTLSDKKRYYIVKAASELFLNKGYGSVSMDEIAGRAKVSKRTVYNHFSAKEVLLLKLPIIHGHVLSRLKSVIILIKMSVKHLKNSLTEC